MRNALTRLNTSSASTSDSSTLFSGRALEVREPHEPSSIRYMELETGFCTKFFRGVISYSIFSSIVYFNFWAVERIFLLSNMVALIVIECLRPIMDTICEFLNDIEVFKSEDNRERSLTFKVCISVVVNEVLVCALAVPFVNSLGTKEHDLLPMVATIYVGATLV